MTKMSAGLAATLLLLPILALAQSSLASQQLELQYATFYSQMKTAAKGDFGQARLGFYLTDPQNGQSCSLLSARVSTPERVVPAEVTMDSELRLPYDDDLNLDKASVWVELGEPHERCDLSVQVMADASSGTMAVHELQQRVQEMQSLLDKLPAMEGVRISLVSPSGTAYLVDGDRKQALPWQDGQLLLGNEQLTQFAAGSLQLEGEILRLTPWLHKG